MHHAHYDFAHGVCPINDVVIASRKLLAEKSLNKIWIIDVDAHKGDGTATLTKGNKKIISLSMHMAEGWPLNLPRETKDGSLHPSYIPSDIDIPIAKGEEDKYLSKLENGLNRLAKYQQLIDDEKKLHAQLAAANQRLSSFRKMIIQADTPTLAGAIIRWALR